MSLALAVATGGVYLVGAVIVILGGDVDPRTPGLQFAQPWTPDWQWLAFLCIWAGLDIAQFAGKRLTDIGYQQARHSGAAPVLKEHD